MNRHLVLWVTGFFFVTAAAHAQNPVIRTSYTPDPAPYVHGDKVYLFTDSEAKIVSDDIRGCGIDWWLRSPGKEQNEAVYILGTAANYMGNDVDHSMGVRPVIRVRYAEQTAEQ